MMGSSVMNGPFLPSKMMGVNEIEKEELDVLNVTLRLQTTTNRSDESCTC